MKRLLLDRVLPAGDRIGWTLGLLAMIEVGVLIVVMLLDSVLRTAGSPTLWGNDITKMLNGTSYLLGAAVTLRLNQHVRIDFLSVRMPARAQHAANVLFYACLFAPFVWYVGGAAVSKALRAFRRGELDTESAWEPLIWPFYAGIAIGLLALGFQALLEAIRHAIGVVDPKAVPLPGAGDPPHA